MKIEIKEPLFDKKYNPNSDIFDVPTELGGEDGDNQLSMVGDAVARHVGTLGPAERIAWEHYIITSNGNIFELVPDFRHHDSDPFNLKTEDLDNYFELHKIPESLRVEVEEAIEQERERRNLSEDAYDRNEGLISFNEWEEYPQMGAHVDLPQTPKEISRYVGNTSQAFYDEFPEGHKDSKTINKFLSLLNKDADEITEKYGVYLKTWLDNSNAELYVREHLRNLVQELVEGKDPIESTKNALTQIDDHWAAENYSKAMDVLMRDALVQVMVTKANEWQEQLNSGINVLPSVKMFGKTLFSKLRGKMKSYHWHLYHRLRNKFVPKIIVKGFDLNRCKLYELGKVIGNSSARNVWLNRPFESLDEMKNKGYITKEQIIDSNGVEKLHELIDLTSKKATEAKNLKIMSALSQKIVDLQRRNEIRLDDKGWSSVWGYYRSTKQDVQSQLKAKEST